MKLLKSIRLWCLHSHHCLPICHWTSSIVYWFEWSFWNCQKKHNTYLTCKYLSHFFQLLNLFAVSVSQLLPDLHRNCHLSSRTNLQSVTLTCIQNISSATFDSRLWKSGKGSVDCCCRSNSAHLFMLRCCVSFWLPELCWFKLEVERRWK